MVAHSHFADLSSSVLDDVTSEDDTEIRMTHREIHIYACAHIRIIKRRKASTVSLSSAERQFDRVRSVFLRTKKTQKM